MLRLTQPRLSLWDAVLPPDLIELPEELKKVDELLGDEAFMAPFRRTFRSRIGRPTIPMDTFLRMMYLKFRYEMGYETLVREVADSIKWRRFCRIPLDGELPHSTTLIKLRKRVGSEVVEQLNRALVGRAVEQKVIRGRKLQVDTTVVPSDIHYPTDARLLADGVRVITRCVRKVQQAGLSVRTSFRNRMRAAKRRLLQINKVRRRRMDEARQEVRRITRAIAEIAQATLDDSRRVLRNARQTMRRTQPSVSAAVDRTVKQLERYVELVQRVVEQTGRVESGERQIPNRLVSLFDLNARPIQRGKPRASTEFGRKVLLQEVEKGLISGYRVVAGAPSDHSLLTQTIEDHRATFGRAPIELATDRGFSSRANEQAAEDAGVKRVAIPRRGRLSRERRDYQRQPWFRRLQRWRAGGEARISLLKRKYGLGRSRFRDEGGTESWVGWGILAHNLDKMASLI
jgi:IS5 family transposase